MKTIYSGPSRTPVETEQAITLAARVFRPDDPDAVAHKHTLLAPAATVSEATTVVLSDEATVIGAVFLVERKMHFPVGVQPMAYLTSICIDPEKQGLGLSRKLMEAALAQAARRGNKVAVVVARRGVDFYYAKFGFHGLSQYPLIEIRPNRVLTTTRPVPHLQVIDSSQHVANLYSQAYERQVGACMRDARMWEFIAWKAKDRGYEFLSLDDQSGYALVAGQDVHELAAASSEAYLDLLLGLFGRTEGGDLRLHGQSHTHPVWDQLAAWDHSLRLRQCRYGGHMLRLLGENAPDHDQTAKALGLSARPYDNAGEILGILYMDEA